MTVLLPMVHCGQLMRQSSDYYNNGQSLPEKEREVYDQLLPPKINTLPACITVMKRKARYIAAHS